MSRHNQLKEELSQMSESADFCDETVRENILSIILHIGKFFIKLSYLYNFEHFLADISNPTKTFSEAKTWAERVVTEFFMQGDVEKEFEKKVAAINDRENNSTARIQVGFIQFCVKPIILLWVETLHSHPTAKGILDQLEENLRTYQSL